MIYRRQRINEIAQRAEGFLSAEELRIVSHKDWEKYWEEERDIPPSPPPDFRDRCIPRRASRTWKAWRGTQYK